MDRYKVVFHGRVLDGYDAVQVKSAFGELFSIPPARLAASFDGREVDVARNIDDDQAERLHLVLTRLGMEVSIQLDAPLAKTA